MSSTHLCSTVPSLFGFFAPNSHLCMFFVRFALMISVYTVFDMERYQIGFANREPHYTLSWQVAVGIACTTVGLLFVALLCAKYCCFKQSQARINSEKALPH